MTLWHIERFQFQERLLDFSSAGLGRRRVRALYADGACLVNAASLLEFDEVPDFLQVEICEECGTIGCKPGGWVALRRLGAAVLWIPCFDTHDDERDRENEFPSYPRGLPFFRAERYAELRGLIPGFPELEKLPPLRTREALRLLQAAAPGRALGKFPEIPRLRSELVLASDSSDGEDASRRLGAVVAAAWARDEPLRECSSFTPITFFLDLVDSAVWMPLARTEKTLAISIGEGCYAVPMTDHEHGAR